MWKSVVILSAPTGERYSIVPLARTRRLDPEVSTTCWCGRGHAAVQRSIFPRAKTKRKERRHVQAELQQCSVHTMTTATMIGTSCLSGNFTDG
jgi:hypothetical protein